MKGRFSLVIAIAMLVVVFGTSFTVFSGFRSGETLRVRSENGPIVLDSRPAIPENNAENPLILAALRPYFECKSDLFKDSLEIKNTGGSVTTIRKLHPSCSCVIPRLAQLDIAPGASLSLPIEIDFTGKARGIHRFKIDLDYEYKGLDSHALLEFSVLHNTDVVLVPQTLHLRWSEATIDAGRFSILDFRPSPMRIKDFVGATERLRAKIVETPTEYLPGWKYVVEVAVAGRDLPVGEYRESLRIITDDQKHPELTIEVLVSVSPSLRVAPAGSIQLTQARQGEPLSGRVFVWDVAGEPISIAGIDVSNPAIQVDVQATGTKKIVCATLNATAARTPGTAELTIRVSAPCKENRRVKLQW